MEIIIPSNFDNFQQRELSNGLETKSTTEYKGYQIILRCYTNSGISSKIVKVLESGKRKILRERHWNYRVPLELLNETKTYIDKYEVNLLKKLN